MQSILPFLKILFNLISVPFVIDGIISVCYLKIIANHLNFLRIKYSLKSIEVLSQITEQIHDSEIGDILENSLQGKRPTYDDCVRLLCSDNVSLIGLVAGVLTRNKFGKKASFLFVKSYLI